MDLPETIKISAHGSNRTLKRLRHWYNSLPGNCFVYSHNNTWQSVARSLGSRDWAHTKVSYEHCSYYKLRVHHNLFIPLLLGSKPISVLAIQTVLYPEDIEKDFQLWAILYPKQCYIQNCVITNHVIKGFTWVGTSVDIDGCSWIPISDMLKQAR